MGGRSCRVLTDFVFNSLGTTVGYIVAVLINLSNLSLVDVKTQRRHRKMRVVIKNRVNGKIKL